MKKGGSDVNGSNLDKNNIIKPTFDTLTEEYRKALETYHYSCYEVMWQGIILKDTTLIIVAFSR
jgi:tRNA A37 threonylcarbamoyladenosine biosynthesis protein TsaE